MRSVIHKLLGSFGLEIRLKSRLEANRREEKRLAHVRPWQQLQCYEPNTILDIGANDGLSARIFRELMPQVKILSFEPLFSCFQQVDRDLRRNPPGQAFHFALGDTNEESVIQRNVFTPSSSFLPLDSVHEQSFPQSVDTVPEAVQIKRLDDVCESLGIIPPFVVKIDVQGFEDKVLKGGEKTFRRASAIVIELSSVSLFKGQPLFDDVHQQLRDLGFFFRGVVDQMQSPVDGRILQFDALYENAGPLE